MRALLCAAVLVTGCLDAPPSAGGDGGDGGASGDGAAGDGDGSVPAGDGGATLGKYHSILVTGSASSGLAVPLVDEGDELATDVGSLANGTGDFTVELWFRGTTAAFPSGADCTNNPGEIFDGMLLVDRDMLGAGDNGDWVITVFANKIQFGMGDQSWGRAVCVAVDETEWDFQNWTYIAAMKDGNNLVLSLYQPSTEVALYELDDQGDVPTNTDLSYDENRAETDMRNAELRLGGGKWVGEDDMTDAPCGGSCVGFTGYIDEVRLSNEALYEMAPMPTSPFQVQTSTVALYRFEATNAADMVVEDVAGSVNGTLTGDTMWTEESAF